MKTNTEADLIVQLGALSEALSRQQGVDAPATIAALAVAAHRLGVPTKDRRDDAPVFIAGTERIETATLAQCGGLLFALAHDDVREPASVAVRVAARLAQLLPAQLAHER